MENKFITYSLITVASALICFCSYAKIWEMKQPKQEIKNAVVESIEKYYNKGGDLHWSSKGNRIKINGENRLIDFPQKKWDNTVKEGSSIDLIVRKSFPWFGALDELDGLYINDYK